MQLFETELEDAKGRLAASGRDAQAYTFAITHLPPDPDGGGMFTARYEIDVTNATSGKSLGLIGGIGLRWVDDFAEALNEGYFD
jgi:hypothetical protein